MAGTSMNDIKARMKSVSSTMQITKAMELVATSKLRRAKEKAEGSRPFYEILRTAIKNIENSAEAGRSVFSTAREVKKTLYVVIAGDRGLAGGYNANVFRLAEAHAKDKDAVFLPIGKKAFEYLNHRKRELIFDTPMPVSEVGVGDALAIGERLTEGFASGEFDKVVLIYTKFVSMISQLPLCEELLPFDKDEGEAPTDPIIEEDPEELLAKILPEYLGGIIYCAVCEATASECGARRSAMNAANKNASEMIDALMLKYNRARQAIITQEITEIVSGAEAL